MSAADFLASQVQTAFAGRRALLLSGPTRDWFLTENTALRLPEFIAQTAMQLGLGTIHYRRGCPPEELVPPGGTPIPGLRLPRDSDPTNVVPELLRLLEDERQAVLVLCDGVENLLPDAESPVSNPEDLNLLDQLQRLPVSAGYSFGRSLLVLAEHVAPVHHRLQLSPGVMRCDVPLPDLSERVRFLALTGQATGSDADLLADATSGLSLDESRFLATTAMASRDGIDLASISRHKADLLRASCPNLELVPTPVGLEAVAGMGVFKARVRAMVERKRIPGMIVFVGPPGTGKSFAARAFARELNRSMLQLHIMNSPYVGENERLMREARRRIDNFGDVIVWIDEIDQQLVSRDGGPQGDSGTANRVMAGFLEWTGDPSRQNVTVVGATNRPDRLDNALRSRALLVVPFLHPTPRDLVTLLPMVAEQLGLDLDPSINLADLVNSPDLVGVSGRYLHGILDRAAHLAWEAKAAVIGERQLRDALRAARGRTSDQDRYWTLLALEHCTDDGLLPWAGRDVVTNADVPTVLHGLVGPTGDIDRDRVRQEIDHYRRRYP